MAETIESNPFVDVSVFLFFEDISDKQGVEGFTNYIVGQAKSLANLFLKKNTITGRILLMQW